MGSKRQGSGLYHQALKMTGLPRKIIQRELKGILEKKNIDANNLTIEQLRIVAASYLRQIMGSLLDKPPPEKQNSH